MALPDFIIVGAMKCGTTTLAAQLALQPGVFMTTPKEPNFFSDDDVYAQGLDWYEKLFDMAPAGDLKGEASTHYTKLPTYPETLARMQAALPALKLIYMVRNPVARSVSHYIHEWTEKRISTLPAEAFDTHGTLVDYSCYGKQIAPFAAAYGIQNIHLVSLEQLNTAPEETFAGIAAFLGLGPEARWQNDLEAQNVSNQRFRPLPGQKLLVDNPVARALRHALVPKGLRAMVRQARTMKKRPELGPELTARLEAIFLEDRTALAELFPGHAALVDSYPFAAK